jgi:hypothetical protein
MYCLVDWIEPFLEAGLSQYLSSRKSIPLTKASERHLELVEELSNLCIPIPASQYLFLLEVNGPKDGWHQSADPCCYL